MGFFNKIKQFFGFVGLKCELETPGQVPKSSGGLQGRISIHATKEQTIASVKVKLQEDWSSGRGDNATERTFELGEATVAQDFAMAAGESKVLDFTLPFELVQNHDDRLQQQGGAMGALGSLGKLASGEKSEYTVIATVDVVGAAFDPNSVKEIKLV